jgi:acyl CoA:acetate/3-ketoacid CoA transferase beta subunit
MEVYGRALPHGKVRSVWRSKAYSPCETVWPQEGTNDKLLLVTELCVLELSPVTREWNLTEARSNAPICSTNSMNLNKQHWRR